mmetsp:Transcript_15767/g.23679  ORF Transcript_15767/g.23679 Transcript_15767/m.23679 type:complete len:91 (-) Transcript_15767:295-567(-)
MCYCNNEGKKKSKSIIKERQMASHIAACAGLRWAEGLECILKNEDFESLAIRDEVTNLLPFQLAALGGNSDLNTIYQMISSYPEALFSDL